MANVSMIAGHALDWSDAYRTHAPDLLRYLRRFTADDAAAYDLVQDCFIRAMRAQRQPPSAQELGPWLVRIASNLAIDALRRSQRRPSVPLHENHAIESMTGAGEAEQVRQVLAALPAEQAIALVLRLHYGFAPAEIAAIVGASEGAVKSRLARARLNFVVGYRELNGGSR